MTPAPLTRSMLPNKHEGEDEITRANASGWEALVRMRQTIEAMDPTTQEKAG